MKTWVMPTGPNFNETDTSDKPAWVRAFPVLQNRDTNKIRTGEDSRNRYEALAGEVCACCNKLTGQNVAAPEDWFDLVEKCKTNLEALWGGK